MFLHEYFKKLNADPDEQFFFVTGSETEGVMVLDQSVERHQRRNQLVITSIREQFGTTIVE